MPSPAVKAVISVMVHNESLGKCFTNSLLLLLLSKRQRDRPPDGLITRGARALEQQGEKERQRTGDKGKGGSWSVGK